MIGRVNSQVSVELDAQYRQLREECGVVERERGVIAVSGPDAAEYLQGQLTNDVEALEPGEGQYAALLDRKGHMQSDLRVLRPAAEEILLETEPGAREAVARHLSMYSIGREVAVADRSGETAVLSLIGPRSAEIAHGGAALPEHACEEVAIGGVACLAAGTAEGIDLIAAADDLPRLREALLAAGAVEVSEAAAEILRIEAGRPRFGAEMGTETMPAEAGIVEDVVELHQGLLHRPGDGRPAPLQGPAEPAPARAAAERPGRAGGAAAAGREGGRPAGQRRRLPRPRPDRAGDPAPRGRARRRARRR